MTLTSFRRSLPSLQRRATARRSVAWQAHLARSDLRPALADDDAGILPDRQAPEHRIDSREHGVGIRTEEEQAGLFRTLPGAAETALAGSGSNLGEDGIEVERRVDLVGKAR